MKKTYKLVTISIYVALAIVLDVIKEFIPLLNMPSGGSINIALIPIALCSFHLGIKEGLIVGSLWFIVTCLLGLNKYFISFGQIFFDYIIPSVIVGTSSFLYRKKKLIEIEFGIFITMLIRTLSICISGAYYWCESSEVAGSVNAWFFSLTYNLPYSIATLLMLLIVIPILLKSLKKYIYNI
ncbi:MAG: ECF transporter S component [Erysipelotrichaceae bacterium]|nr:ECF transporter S component [Erysipelotrichaceae bacterium]